MLQIEPGHTFAYSARTQFNSYFERMLTQEQILSLRLLLAAIVQCVCCVSLLTQFTQLFLKESTNEKICQQISIYFPHLDQVSQEIHTRIIDCGLQLPEHRSRTELKGKCNSKL